MLARFKSVSDVTKKRNKRFPITLPILKEVRLSLFAHAYGNSKTGMAEQILIERLSNDCAWQEIQKELRQEAAIRQTPLEELIKEVLKSDGYQTEIDVDAVNWSALLDTDTLELAENLDEE